MSAITQIAPTWGRHKGQRVGQLAGARWTTRDCPPDDTRVTRDLGIEHLSRVDAHRRPTLQRRVVVPNPQHLLLTLFFETSLHEEKCPL
jgi:hypothetical protein